MVPPKSPRCKALAIHTKLMKMLTTYVKVVDTPNVGLHKIRYAHAWWLFGYGFKNHDVYCTSTDVFKDIFLVPGQ